MGTRIRTIGDIINTLVDTGEDVLDLYSGFLDDEFSNHILNNITIDGEEVKLSKEDIYMYKMNPKLMSYDLYKTPDLGPFLLMLNKMVHPSEFTLDAGTVMVLTKEDVHHIMDIYDDLNKNK